MASTNKTTNYELSQFLGTDKPAWLADYNQDMAKIDTQMKANADAATTASGSATTANTSIGTLSNLTTTANTDLVSAINEVELNAETAQQTANQATTVATAANSKADNLINQFNLSTLRTPSELTYTASAGTIGTGASRNITIVSNQDQSLAKIYGIIGLDGIAGTGDLTVTVTNTGLALDNTITIAAHGYFTAGISNLQAAGRYSMLSVSIVLTNDTMTITIPRNSNINAGNIILGNSLLFLKDFGDIVIPN